MWWYEHQMDKDDHMDNHRLIEEVGAYIEKYYIPGYDDIETDDDEVNNTYLTWHLQFSPKSAVTIILPFLDINYTISGQLLPKHQNISQYIIHYILLGAKVPHALPALFCGLN